MGEKQRKNAQGAGLQLDEMLESPTFTAFLQSDQQLCLNCQVQVQLNNLSHVFGKALKLCFGECEKCFLNATKLYKKCITWKERRIQNPVAEQHVHVMRECSSRGSNWSPGAAGVLLLGSILNALL